MQTRSQSRSTTTNTSKTVNYNNRLRNRILKLETSFDETPVDNYHSGPAYNTRLAHNVLYQYY